MFKLLLVGVITLFFGHSLKAQYDLEPLYIGYNNYYNSTGAKDLVVTYTQHSADWMTSLNCHWQINDGPIYTVLVTGFDLYPGTFNSAKNKFTLTADQASNNYSFPTNGMHKVKLWLTPISGTEINTSNDTLIQWVKIIPELPEKRVALQFYTHTTCGPCVPGAKRVDKICETYPNNVLRLSIHRAPGDPYEIPECILLNTVFSEWGHPTILNDQYLFPWFDEFDPLNAYDYWDTTLKTDDRMKFLSPIGIDFTQKTYDPSSRLLTVHIKLTAYDTIARPLSINYWMLEDSVLGPQLAAPDPDNYYHRNVLRAMPGGVWGNPSLFPDTLFYGDVFETSFSYTIPIEHDENYSTLLVTVQGFEPSDIYKRDIINSNWIKTSETDFYLSNKRSTSPNFEIFPNPASQNITIKINTTEKLQLSFIDLTGKQYLSATLNEQVSVINLPDYISPGIYLVRITNEFGELYCQKIIVQ